MSCVIKNLSIGLSPKSHKVQRTGYDCRGGIVMCMARAKLMTLMLLGLLVLFPGTSIALNILLTNDDGYNHQGIKTMRTALLEAGHTVTIVAPRENQSGAGGTITTGYVKLVRVLEEEPGIWSVAGTPSDCILAAIGGIMAESLPDLVVSGANLGSNLGASAVRISGTINAALTASNHGISAIAVSVGLDYPDEYPDYSSTYAAFPSVGSFTADLIDALLQSALKAEGKILPSGVILNVNVPVPFESIQGAVYTHLAQTGIVEYVWNDLFGVVSAGGGSLVMYARRVVGPDSVPKSDRDAFVNGFISLTMLDGTMRVE